MERSSSDAPRGRSQQQADVPQLTPQTLLRTNWRIRHAIPLSILPQHHLEARQSVCLTTLRQCALAALEGWVLFPSADFFRHCFLVAIERFDVEAGHHLIQGAPPERHRGAHEQSRRQSPGCS